MSRHRLGYLALAATVGVAAACDSDDGREMQPPDSYAVFQLQSTTPSTTSTVPTPTELVPITMAPTTTTPTTSQTSSAVESTIPGGDSASAPVESASAASADSTAGALQFSGPWESGTAIPVEYTCDGTEAAPLVSWTAPPSEAAELAVSVVDDDADGFVHWLVVGIPAAPGELGGEEPVTGSSEPASSSDNVAWTGPCPLPGSGPHSYRFTLHVLDQAVELPADAPTDELLAAIEAATATSASFTGTYERA